jgi:transposase-like protein
MIQTNPYEFIRNGRQSDGISPRQEAVALALAAGHTIEAAAPKGQCAVPTVKGWLATQPAFKRRIAELRAEMTERALGKLADAMSVAADTLRHLCLRGKTESIRLKAAEALFTHGVKVRESIELHERIRVLEEERQL